MRMVTSYEQRARGHAHLHHLALDLQSKALHSWIAGHLGLPVQAALNAVDSVLQHMMEHQYELLLGHTRVTDTVWSPCGNSLTILGSFFEHDAILGKA